MSRMQHFDWFKSLLSGRSSRNGNSGFRNPLSRKLHIEPLEDRRLLHGSIDGTWIGTTGQGNPIEFDVSNHEITRLLYEADISGSICSQHLSQSTTGLLATIDGAHNFSTTIPAGDITTDFSGVLTTDTSGNGTLIVTDSFCLGSVNTTWNATRDGGPVVLDVINVFPDPRNTSLSTVDIGVSETIDLNSFSFEDVALTRDGSPVALDASIQLGFVSGVTYRLSGLDAFTGNEGTYLLTVNGAGLQDLAGNFGSGSAADTWVMDTAVAVVTDVLDVSPDPRTFTVTSVEVLFSDIIDLTTFSSDDIILTRDGSPVTLFGVGTEQAFGNRYRITGLASETLPDGAYELSVDASGILFASGNMGLGSDSDTWVMNRFAPTVLDVIDVAPDPRDTSVSQVDVVFSEPIDLTTFAEDDIALTRDGTPVVLDGSVTTSFVSGNTYQVSGLETFTNLPGAYVLTVDATAVQDVLGRIGFGSDSDDWVTEPIDLVVDTFVDESDGDFSAGDLSLREAIELANTNPGADAITFDLMIDGSTIMLDDLLGELNITDAVTIDASSLPGGLTIDAGNGTDNAPGTSDGFRIFNIDDGNANNQVDVEFSKLTLTGGDVADEGGAILNRENLTVTSSTISGNSANFGGGISNRTMVSVTDSTLSNNSVVIFGGGISNLQGTATITDSMLSDNSATTFGGGIFNGGTPNISGIVIVTRSTISGNAADLGGGGLYNSNGMLSIASSTLSGNSVNYRGGGIFNRLGTAIVTNSTISGNSTNSQGGGIYNFDNGTVTITESTLSGNSANVGGGIFNKNTGNITLDHTIVANSTVTGGENDVAGTVTATWSLIEDNTDATINGTDNITGIDPMLGPLADNGGLTQTHAISSSSPAIDAGDPAAIAGMGIVPLYDQRGIPFSRVLGRIDIGAIEDVPSVLVVDTLVDESDGNFVSGDVSLREAIELANANPVGSEIRFDASLNAGTIALTLSELAITDDVIIDASTLTGGLTIDALGNDPTPGVDQGDGSRIFNIDDGNAGSNIDVEIRGLTLNGGDVSGDGGAIRSKESLTLINLMISDNSATGLGGGIYSVTDSASIMIASSTLSGNIAARGGGFYAQSNDSILEISQSDFSLNAADQHGGGIMINTVTGSTLITGSMISGNTTANYDAGGIRVSTEGGGTTTISSSTIIDNSSNRAAGGILAVTLTGGTVTLSKSTIDNNTAVDEAGGISWFLLETGTAANIIDSTISGNISGSAGGGIHAVAYIAGTSIQNTTISGNSAGDFGGGIYLRTDPGELTRIANSTIAHNTAATSGTGAGGGIYVTANGQTPLFDHDVVAGNSLDTGMGDDLFGSIAAASSYNFIGINTGYVGPGDGIQGNQIGAAGLPIDPLLGPLTDNGGLTQTHALLSGSPAIDTGDPAFAVPPAYDQRGFAFSRVVNGQIDIGSYESSATSADFDSDDDVDGADFLSWQRGFGTSPAAVHADGDANVNGTVDGDDLSVWKGQFGTIVAPVASISTSHSSYADVELVREAQITFPPAPTNSALEQPFSAELLDLAVALVVGEHSMFGREDLLVFLEEPLPEVSAAVLSDHSIFGSRQSRSHDTIFATSNATNEGQHEPEELNLTDRMLEKLLDRVFD